MAAYRVGLELTAVYFFVCLVHCLFNFPVEGRHLSVDNSDMSTVQANWYYIGTDNPNQQPNGGGPRRPVKLNRFYIDKFIVSNADFEKFVKATNHETYAEKSGSSFVFDQFLSPAVMKNISQAVVNTTFGVLSVKKATWRRPEGIGSSISDRMNLAVVHVSWNDAAAYCKWVDKRLPTEAEWEVTCRSGPDDKRHPWGNNKLMPNGQPRENSRHKKFPADDTVKYDYDFSNSVSHFPLRNYEHRNPIVNVLEWTADWWKVDHNAKRQTNPTGPRSGSDKVIKGGSSYACQESYCARNNCAARSHHFPDFSANNIGFRCALTHFYQ